MATENLDPTPSNEWYSKQPTKFLMAVNEAEQKRLDRRFMIRWLVILMALGIVYVIDLTINPKYHNAFGWIVGAIGICFVVFFLRHQRR
jgi:hypothetical protein